MNLFFIFFKIFVFSLNNFNSFYSLEALNNQNEKNEYKNIKKENITPLDAINSYKNFFESINFLELDEAKREILAFENFEKLNEEENNLLIKIKEIFSNFEKLKKKMEKSIKDYEIFIDTFLNEKIFFNKNLFISKNLSFEEIKDYFFLESLLKEKLNNLEKEIFDLQNNNPEEFFYKDFQKDKDKNFSSNKKSLNRNLTLKKKIKNQFEIIKKIFIKEKELEYKILISKKNFYLEEINYLINFVENLKKKDFIEKYNFSNFLKKEKLEKKLLFEQINILSRDYENFLKINESKNLKEKNEYYLNNELEALIEKAKDLNKDKKFFKEKLEILLNVIQKEYKDIEIDYLEKKTFIIEKNLDFIELWKVLCDEKIESEKISDLIGKIKAQNLEVEIENLEKEKDLFLEIITNYSLLEEVLKKNNFNDLKNEYINEQKVYLLKIIDFYNEIIPEIKKIKYIDITIKEQLKSKKFWVRAKNSISLEEFYIFKSDIKSFLYNIKIKFFPFLKNLKSTILLNNNLNKIFILKNFLFLILIFISAIFYHTKIEEIKYFILKRFRENFFLSRLGLIIEFLVDQGVFFYLWSVGLLICFFNYSPSKYLSALYFLFSIPYYWYLIYKFMKIFEKINKEKEYIFVNHDYVVRFLFLLKMFLYTFSFVFFFKEAYLNIMVVNSSSFTIFKAVQYIIFQITLIFLIKKEEIINLIPENNKVLFFLKSLLIKYYSLFVSLIVALIIMSNPYVGYGSQVLYFITRIVLTSIVLPIIYNLYFFIKNKSLKFFVEIEEGDLKNNFPAATSCYLIFTILTYIGSIFLFYIFINKIWNLNYNQYHIFEFLNKNLIEIANNEKDGLFYLSIIGIFRVIFLTLIGYVASYVFNIFVLSQILNDVVISVSMQQTLMTLFQYFFVVCFFVLSLYSSGLQGLTTKIAFLIGFLGFAIKEPVSDFISYFIILIQRPIKIGDFIKIYHDYEISGIVRKITPRTTLVRQRNSQIIVIPNSIIVTKLVSNWNYAKNNFIGTEDIILNIDFEEDVEIVKNIIQKALESHPAILKNPAPIVRCEDFTPSGYQFLARGYMLSERVFELFEITSSLRMLIVKSLAQKGIKISAPNCYVSFKKNKVEDK